MSPLALIGVPFSMGALAPGQELAPRALRDAALVELLVESGVEVHDHGDLPVKRWAPDELSPRARHLGEVLTNVAAVRTAVRAALESGERVLVVGGDGTIGLGAIDAVGGTVIHLDPSADMNVPLSAPNGALASMALGHALDLPGAHPRLSAACTVSPADLVLLGLAGGHATEFEREHIEALGLTVVTRDELADDPFAATHRALAAADTGRPICVDFDVDLVDFNDAPLGEPVAVGPGVSFDQVFATLATLLSDPRVVAVTVAEHNPQHGAEDGSDTSRLAEALAGAIAGWAQPAADDPDAPPDAPPGNAPSSSSSDRLRATPPA